MQIIEKINSYIFVYGTLLDDSNEFGAYLMKGCAFIADAKFKGVLYDIGEYPGAIPAPHEEVFVYGSVFLMARQEKMLKILDEYEGFGDEQEHPNLFIRRLVEVETAERELVKCWIYLYNLPVQGLRQIISGKY